MINSFAWFQFGEFECRGRSSLGPLRFFAGDPTAGVFMTGFFPVMMFGLPAACCDDRHGQTEHRKSVAGMLFGVAFTSFLTGITEPTSFSSCSWRRFCTSSMPY